MGPALGQPWLQSAVHTGTTPGAQQEQLLRQLPVPWLIPEKHGVRAAGNAGKQGWAEGWAAQENWG